MIHKEQHEKAYEKAFDILNEYAIAANKEIVRRFGRPIEALMLHTRK